MSVEPDAWRALRRYTAARIGLGRTGVSLSTQRALEFQAAHAAARTAVHEEMDAAALSEALSPLFTDPVLLASEAHDRPTYLRRPDLGRLLSAPSRDALHPHPADVAVIVADGLSARAVMQHAAPLLTQLIPRLLSDGLSLAPLCLVRQGRVAVGDEIGEALGVRLVLMLIGERPGLSAADSLGIYITHDPAKGRSDAERNCISNVRPGGLSFDQAAYRAHFLVSEALRRRLTGVALKDETVEPDALPKGSAAFLLPHGND